MGLLSGVVTFTGSPRDSELVNSTQTLVGVIRLDSAAYALNPSIHTVPPCAQGEFIPGRLHALTIERFSNGLMMVRLPGILRGVEPKREHRFGSPLQRTAQCFTGATHFSWLVLIPQAGTLPAGGA